MALRMSGHLLVGLSRIYAKKVAYLLSDSDETVRALAARGKGAPSAAVDLDAEEEPAAAATRVTRDKAPAKEKK